MDINNLPYKPNSGILDVPSGPTKAGVAVPFGFTTGAVHDQGKNGKFSVTAAAGFNTRAVVVFAGTPKTVSGSQASANWPFGPGHLALESSKRYEGTITTDNDSPGLTLHLQAK